jgi:hypothetical protein
MAFPASTDSEAVVAATAALIEAGRWADDPVNRDETVRLLCRHALPGLPADLVKLILDGRLALDPWAPTQTVDRMVFAEGTNSFPSIRQAGWYFEQMARWGHLPPDSAAAIGRIGDIWRPDLWAQAACRLGITPPDETTFRVPAPVADEAA